LSRHSRRDSGRVNNSDLDAPHHWPPPSPSCSVESAKAGVEVAPRNSPRLGRRLAARCVERSGVQPTFQRTSTRASRHLPSAGLVRARRVGASWRFTRFGSPRSAVSRLVVPSPRANQLSSDAPFKPLPAGPHERHRHSATRSAFSRRGVPASRKPPVGLCNQREDRAHPRSGPFPRTRRVSTDAWPSKACGRQSAGYPVGSRAPALPVAPTRPSFGTRHERPARNRRRAPLSDSVAADCPERHRLTSCPEARLLPAARTAK
jgi:hypothetical protein